jgi:hypothetical protein
MTLNARINFGNKYASRPDGKFNIRNEKYPTLFLNWSSSGKWEKYEFDHINAQLTYDLKLENKGVLGMNLKAGKFFECWKYRIYGF